MKPLDVDVDGILEDTGKFGRYQIYKFMLWGAIPLIFSSLHASNFIFAAREVPYRCRIYDCEGNSSIFDQPWLSNAIPDESKCERFAKNSSWIGDVPEGTCPAQYFNNTLRWTCDDNYVFGENNSLVEELDIPCETWKRTLIGTLHSVGTLIVLLFIGTLSDRFGRRHAFIISGVVEGILGVIKGFSVNYIMFATMELLEPSLGSGMYSSIYLLTFEFLTPGTRVLGGCLVNIFFGIGQVLVGCTAYLLPYWRTYIIVLYAPSILLFLLYWVYDESPRWLISKMRYEEAKVILNKVAETNKKTISEKSMQNLNYNIENMKQIEDGMKDDEDLKKPSPWREVLRSRILIIRVIKTSFWWITCTFCFYGLSINSAVLPGNQYVNYIISAATEIPAHVMAYFGMTYFGRKRTLFVCYLLGGISLLGFPFIPDDLQWLALMTYFIGKLFVTAAFNGIYLYTSELFPTMLRHSLLATCSMIGRIGSITAPQTPLLAEIVPELPAYLFASFCLISALLMTTSPETLGRRIPETVEEAENISSSKRNLIGEE